MVDDEGVRLCGELAAADAGVLVGQVLADQGKRKLERSEDARSRSCAECTSGSGQ